MCSCNVGYMNAPPNCRPECIVNSECPLDKACINQKCDNPCLGICGYEAICKVINHSPVCSCPINYVGDPFSRCTESKLCKMLKCISCLHVFAFVEPKIIQEMRNPCTPSPCGPFSECRVLSNRPVCSCSPNYYGHPPNCKPECVVNSECPLDKMCQNQRCIDPCPGSCGTNAQCQVINHTPTCYCIADYTGDPFSGCSRSKILFYTSLTN